MGLNNRDRFENHMDVSSPETVGDAEKVTDVENQDPYDDMFDEKLDLAEQFFQGNRSDEREPIDHGKHDEGDKKALNDSSMQPPNTPHLGDKKEKEISGDIVFESVVDANPQYGEGGGTQLFIRNFGEMGEDGRFKRLNIDEKGHTIDSLSPENSDNISDVYLSTTNHQINNSAVRNGQSKEGNFTFSIDERGISEDDLYQLDQNTNPNSEELGKIPVDEISPTAVTKVITVEEDGETYERTYVIDTADLSTEERDIWNQMDGNTIDEQGLPRAMSTREQQGREDWQQPVSDQEDMKGAFNPDGWKQSRELKPGEIFYQVRPLGTDRPSPYVTDSSTIESCREKDGSINLEKLLGKLQISPGDNTTYTLRAFEYVGGEKSNRDRG